MRTIIAVVCVALGLPLLGAAPAPREDPPGEGVICALGIYSAVAEVARRCDTAIPPDVLTGVETAVTKLDAYVLANGWTPEMLSRFKREQGLVEAPQDRICDAEMIGFAEGILGAGSGEIAASVDDLVAAPGTPTWGTCL